MNLKSVTTKYKNEQKSVVREEKIFKKDNNIEMQVINVHPEIEYQEIEGFGGAITEASAYIYSKMTQDNKKELIKSYFSKEGHKYNITRMHIDSSDFAVDMYEALKDPEDREFKTFELDRDEKYVLPLLREANAASKEGLKIMLTPWSPPAFMKTTNKRVQGGKLKDEYRELWAEYVCKYIQEYRLKGFNVDRITIQNEPNASQTWDSCLFSGEEEKIFLRDFLYPALLKNNLKDIEVNIWDHNKERMYERACEIIDDETDKMVDGIAFHWYTGDHFEAINLVREKFPNKKLIFSEGCVEYSKLSNTGQLRKAQIYAHDIIGNINAGMNTFIEWNILLDEKGGPNHVDNFCDAPIMYDTLNHKIDKKLSYDYIGHFSRYINPGAKRIGFSKYTSKLEMTALKNQSGEIVMVLMNKEKEDIPASVRINGKVIDIVVAADSIMTCIIENI